MQTCRRRRRCCCCCCCCCCRRCPTATAAPLPRAASARVDGLLPHWKTARAAGPSPHWKPARAAGPLRLEFSASAMCTSTPFWLSTLVRSESWTLVPFLILTLRWPLLATSMSGCGARYHFWFLWRESYHDTTYAFVSVSCIHQILGSQLDLHLVSGRPPSASRSVPITHTYTLPARTQHCTPSTKPSTTPAPIPVI